MRQEKSFRSEAAVITTGLAMGESPRWHDGRLWVSDWGAQEIPRRRVAVTVGRRMRIGNTNDLRQRLLRPWPPVPVT